jgi:O-acetyl-ADP-ribose deacetylase (regulator of RNase III)
MEITVGLAKLQLIQDDLTNVEADAVVNAANSTLLGGGGVDGAIHRVGGPKILDECKRIRATDWPDGLPTGQAVITSGGNLKAKFVVHTVGPVWRGGLQNEPKLLRLAYRNCLKLAVQKGLKTVAFPYISTGAYGYPTEEAAQVALKAVVDFLKSDDNLERVTFVLFSQHDLDIYVKALKYMVP